MKHTKLLSLLPRIAVACYNIQQWPQAFCGDQIQTFCEKANQSIDEDGKNVYFLLQKVAFQVGYTLVLTEAELVTVDII